MLCHRAAFLGIPTHLARMVRHEIFTFLEFEHMLRAMVRHEIFSWTSQLHLGWYKSPSIFSHFEFETHSGPQRTSWDLFLDISTHLKKMVRHEIFWLWPLRTSTACNISSQICPDGFALAAWAPTFRHSGDTQHSKNIAFRDFSCFARSLFFCLLTLSLWLFLFSDCSHLLRQFRLAVSRPTLGWDGTECVLLTSCDTALAKAKDFVKDGHYRTQPGLSTTSWTLRGRCGNISVRSQCLETPVKTFAHTWRGDPLDVAASRSHHVPLCRTRPSFVCSWRWWGFAPHSAGGGRWRCPEGARAARGFSEQILMILLWQTQPRSNQEQKTAPRHTKPIPWRENTPKHEQNQTRMGCMGHRQRTSTGHKHWEIILLVHSCRVVHRAIPNGESSSDFKCFFAKGIFKNDVRLLFLVLFYAYWSTRNIFAGSISLIYLCGNTVYHFYLRNLQTRTAVSIHSDPFPDCIIVFGPRRKNILSPLLQESVR